MIDIDRLELDCKLAIESGHKYLPATKIDTASDMIELITRLRQAEKYAARYRWLRDESAFTHDNAPLAFFTDTNGDQITFDFDGSSYSVLHDEMLDAAIDEAMQCSK